MKTFNRRSFFGLLAGAAAAATSLPKVLRAAKSPPTLTITDIDFEDKTITFSPVAFVDLQPPDTGVIRTVALRPLDVFMADCDYVVTGLRWVRATAYAAPGASLTLRADLPRGVIIRAGDRISIDYAKREPEKPWL